MRAVEALVELSHDCLDIIAWSLSELLERLAKVSPHCQLRVFVCADTTLANRCSWPSHRRSPAVAIVYPEGFVCRYGGTLEFR
jgi:hypothetical protein